VEDNDTLGEEGVLLFFVKKYVIEFCVQNFWFISVKREAFVR
jgi:hypothetical protein